MLADGYSPVQQTTRSFNFSQRSLPTGRAATRLVAAAGATIRSQSKTLRHRHAIYFSTTSYPRSCSWLLQSRLRLWSSSWFLQCCLLCHTRPTTTTASTASTASSSTASSSPASSSASAAGHVLILLCAIPC